jgi:indolepyruvate ferredoxin oxidoreductase alpha subunit
MVTRVCHSRGLVRLGTIPAIRKKGIIVKDPKRFVMLPSNARIRHQVLLDKINDTKKISEKSLFNRIEGNSPKGIITSGASYNYVKDALNTLKFNASILKLSMIFPLAETLIRNFVKEKESIIIVEELDPYLEIRIKALMYDQDIRIKILGKTQKLFPRYGELSTRIVIEGFSKAWNISLPIDYNTLDIRSISGLKLAPNRPPVMCPGCPHMATLYAIKKVTKGRSMYSTDIGCYTLGATPPLSIGDILLCMGSSIGVACGIEKVIKEPVLAIAGDSTFFHAAIPGLINAVYNNHRVLLIVVDNLTTAMTGHQPHPGIGVRANGSTSIPIKIEEIASACGVKYVKVIDPYNIDLMKSSITEALNIEGPSVIVSRRICIDKHLRNLRKMGGSQPTYEIVSDLCMYNQAKLKSDENDVCLICIRELGCPAILKQRQKVIIDSTLCSGCSICSQICPTKAIKMVES